MLRLPNTNKDRISLMENDRKRGNFEAFFPLRARYFVDYVPEEVKEILVTSNEKLTVRHCQALVNLKDYPEKQ